MVAETDQGWFTWSQPAVQLSRATYTTTNDQTKDRWVIAESPELTVMFPKAFTIQHAWITAARTHGDAYFGWDARGSVTCAPPDFVSQSTSLPWKVERTPQAGDPTPAPAPPPAIAVAAAQPLPAPSCEHPFTAAIVSKPVQPVFPKIVKDEGMAQSAAAMVYVVINPNGKVADAWIFASSGYPLLDQSALDAAKHSSYIAPTSYCQAISGTYLFKADFQPY